MSAPPTVGSAPQPDARIDRALRLAVDVREWHRGRSTGIARFLTNFIGWAAAHRPHELVLIGNQHTEPRVSDPKIRFRVLAEHHTLAWDQVTLPRALRRERVDLFLSPYYKMPLASPCPAVVTLHDVIGLRFPAYRHEAGRLGTVLRRCWLRTMLSRAGLVVTDSEFSRGDIAAALALPESKIVVVPIGLDGRFLQARPDNGDAAARRRYGLPAEYVLYVGRDDPHKNLDTLVTAWGRLPESIRARYPLVLAGRGTETRAPLVAGIVVAGFIEDDDLPAVYAGARAFAFPSCYEGFGLPPLEAMAAGVPVIAAEATSLPEVLGDAALLVPATNADAWRQGLEQILEDDGVRARLKQRGRQRARRFVADKTASVLMGHLERLASANADRSVTTATRRIRRSDGDRELQSVDRQWRNGGAAHPRTPGSRTILLTHDFPPGVGGIAAVFDRLWRDAASHADLVVAPRLPQSDTFDLAYPVRIVRFPAPPWGAAGKLIGFFSGAAWSLASLLRYRPERFVAGQLVRAGPLAHLWKAMTGTPYCLWVYGGETHPGFTPLPALNRYLRRVLRGAQIVFTNSGFTTDEMKEFGLPDERIVELPLGVDDSFRPAPREPAYVERLDLDGKLVFLTVGRLVERKGVDTVLRALAELDSELPPWRYLVVSDGPFRERLEALAARLGLADRVTFTGFVAAEELPVYYNLCDIFVMPNREVRGGRHGSLSIEGFGIVFLEAAACGKPVIAGRSGGAVHAVQDGETGLVIDPTDVDAVAAAIDRLLDPGLRSRMGAAGVDFASRFRWNRTARLLAGYLAGVPDSEPDR